MNLKKLTLVAVLAVSQVAASVPAFAEAGSTTRVSAATEVTPVTETNVQPAATDPLPPLLPDGSVATPPAASAPAETPLPENAVPTPTPTPPTTPMTTQSPEFTTEPTAQPSPGASQTITPAGAGSGQLILMFNSNKMYADGKEYLANQPMAVKNGVSYVSIRAMVERVGVKYIYDYKTKETIVTSGTNVMRFKTDSKVYTVNGQKVTMKGPAYQYKGTFMIPLTSITYALGIKYTVDNVGKRVIMTLNTKPTASFTVQPTEIYAGQTLVNFVTTSSSPNGTAIVDERWDGNKQDIYDQPGFYTVTYSAGDANGNWSDPYSVTFEVIQPNQPPVANFTTDKDEYKMGEPVTINDLSSDPEGEALTVEWTNRALAFFNPGPVSLQLKVTDKQGLSSTFEKTINITSEQLYTQEEVEKLFTAPGDVIIMDGGMIPGLPNLNYNLSSEPFTLIRSNSPETVNTNGVLYRENALGATRFLVHHMNNMATKKKVYILATNNSIYANTITTQFSGFAGPVTSPEYTGKISTQKYYNSMITNEKYSQVILQPGQTLPILTDVNKIAMKPKEVISLSADIFSEYPVDYNVVMVDENADPVAVLPTLPVLDRDGVHNRGTYPDSTRVINVTDVVGTTQSKMVLGDNDKDKNLVGMDPMNGTETSNAGNFGVLYKIKLERVAPNTLITFNPRGGNYLGSVMVNGTIVNLPNKGSLMSTDLLKSSDLNAVVYRTGEYENAVDLTFSVASGSNLPVNLVFTPLPPKK
ncbi:copper amine oxidase N-terminal domain-containing protein [Paenibacillus albidus]|uniref:stalk domain-containing protein n=1 Tax=Paenibacillus albidus TaxID=2041023 RepID=UPI001BE5F9B6|nr:stalk domain-containing protein [Paenibacillus albidus]MBT2290649.1 copper amine oxidase N-terminal domain-containing protein [Paenibacillus albidus]